MGVKSRGRDASNADVAEGSATDRGDGVLDPMLTSWVSAWENGNAEEACGTDVRLAPGNCCASRSLRSDKSPPHENGEEEDRDDMTDEPESTDGVAVDDEETDTVKPSPPMRELALPGRANPDADVDADCCAIDPEPGPPAPPPLLLPKPMWLLPLLWLPLLTLDAEGVKADAAVTQDA